MTSGFSKFVLQLHHWEEGVFKKVVHEFETIAEALGFMRNSGAHHGKIFNGDGELIHSGPCSGQNSDETYA